tara:strand:+ start:36431 stop:37072 length:642 start_codon:yes stop_codon:yes gene_type:complete
MQAIERELISNNWVVLLFISGLLLMFLLKLFNAEKMKGYSLSIFNKGFVEIESQEKSSNFSLFNIAFTAFSFLSISLSLYFLLNQYSERAIFSFLDYTRVSSYVLIYMLGRFILETFLMNLLEVKELLGYFFLSKRSYLYSISTGLLFLNAIYFYGFPKTTLLLVGVILLFTTRLLLILINNKKLIVKELFYFILYLCAFEIAPLFILFKLIF